MSVQGNRIANLVTVVISTYNYQQYLLDALNGLTRQTYSKIELILVDDCSTDNTSGLVGNWFKENRNSFYNFIYLKLPRNCYSSWALNIGFYISKGEFIVIHDADDISYELKLEKQVQWLKAHPETAAVGTSFWAIENAVNYKPFWLSYNRDEIILNYKVKEKHCVSFGTLMFRAEILENVIGVKKNPDKLNDYIFLKDIVNQGYIVDNLEESLMNIRLHPGQLSEKYFRNFTESIPINEGSFKKIKNRVSIVLTVQDLSGAIIKVLDSIAAQLYPELEVIIVDPHSHINMEQMVKKWYLNYQEGDFNTVIKELFYFRLPIRINSSWIYNIGSYLARGEYIAYQRDSQSIEKNKIQRQLEFLANNSAYSAVITESQNKNKIATLLLKANVIDQTAGFGKIENEVDFLHFIYLLAQKGYNYQVLEEHSRG